MKKQISQNTALQLRKIKVRPKKKEKKVQKKTNNNCKRPSSLTDNTVIN